MAHPAGKKEEGRAKLLTAAGKGFRSLGYGGAGVDALAKQADATSGAFYAHFKSKASAFRDVVVAGLADLKDGVAGLRAEQGPDWRRAFIRFYLGPRRTCALSESCALQSLTNDVARADEDTRQAYTTGLEAVIATVQAQDGGDDATTRADAIALLALLAGGVSLARAVTDPALSDEIAAAVERAALQLQSDQAAASP